MSIRYKGEIKFEPYWMFPITPENVRKVYGTGCRYLGAWGKENTEDHLHALYYQPNPPKPEFSDYFLLSNWGGEVYISNGLNFTNKSTGAVRYFWKFGDGGLSNEVNPAYVYNQYGTYKIQLYGYDKDGCVDSSSSNEIFKVLEKPKADFTFLPAMPKLPNATVNFIGKPLITTAI